MLATIHRFHSAAVFSLAVGMAGAAQPAIHGRFDDDEPAKWPKAITTECRVETERKTVWTECNILPAVPTA